MSYNFTVSVVNYATENDFPATGETDRLYTNSANDNIHYWTGSAYSIYVGPHPHH